MKIAVRTLLAAAALATIVRLPAQEAKRTLSLDEAIAVALTENPAMKAAEFEEKAATQERRAACVCPRSASWAPTPTCPRI